MALTSLIRHVEVLDTSATDGSGLTGKTYSDFTAKYCIDGGTMVSLTTETITTLGTYQAPTSSAHIRIKELNSADPTKGMYEVHFHNDQLTSGTRLWLYMSVTGGKVQRLEVDLQDVKDVNVTQLGGVSQSLTDLKDFADSGYDPSAHKVQGVVLVDTTTTNTDMRGTDSAATASALATAQADLDILTGSDGVTLATAQANYAPAKAGDAMALTSGERTTLAGVIWAVLTSGLATAGSIGKLIVDYLDAAISSRSTYAGGDTSGTTTLLSRLTSTRAGYLDSLTNVDATVSSRAVAGDAMTLTTGERTAIANEVEAQIIDDTDSEKVLQAITDKIAAVNPSLDDLTLAGIASAVRTELTTELARIDAAISSRLASASYSAPPSAATNASAVRTELAVELARIDATVSSRGTSTLDAAAVRTALGLGSANLDTQLSTIDTNVDTLLARITGLLTDASVSAEVKSVLLPFFRLLSRKDSAVATDHSTELGEINANTGTGIGSYVSTTDALQALRDRGDAAWTTGAGGGSGGEVSSFTAEALAQLQGAGITVTSPDQSDADTITIIQGDDYKHVDGRSFTWTNSAADWPDLTDATFVFRVKRKDVVAIGTGSSPTPSGSGQNVRCEITAAQTALLDVGNGLFEVEATLSNGDIYTLVTGAALVKQQLG